MAKKLTEVDVHEYMYHRIKNDFVQLIILACTQKGKDAIWKYCLENRILPLKENLPELAYLWSEKADTWAKSVEKAISDEFPDTSSYDTLKDYCKTIENGEFPKCNVEVLNTGLGIKLEAELCLESFC